MNVERKKPMYPKLKIGRCSMAFVLKCEASVLSFLIEWHNKFEVNPFASDRTKLKWITDSTKKEMQKCNPVF